ncbi:transmembrane protein 89-like [Myotis daubentonii]|uniref:transmembrane protein 89-like n=1 Tax=Myotis daubentonii TaxID=98922 RepID=UPI0028733A5B|nr:transmembrane protein 89-like [Myotis daubentonii]
MQYLPSFLLLLLLLAMSAPSQAWSWPLWYQVGLDLQPWGCQPNSLEGCGISLGCPGYWLRLGMKPIYLVMGVMLTSAMILIVRRKVLKRRGPQGARNELPQVPAHTPRLRKRRTQVSQRARLLKVLHMTDSLLAKIQGHLEHLAEQQPRK